MYKQWTTGFALTLAIACGGCQPSDHSRGIDKNTVLGKWPDQQSRDDLSISDEDANQLYFREFDSLDHLVMELNREYALWREQQQTRSTYAYVGRTRGYEVFFKSGLQPYGSILFIEINQAQFLASKEIMAIIGQRVYLEKTWIEGDQRPMVNPGRTPAEVETWLDARFP